MNVSEYPYIGVITRKESVEDENHEITETDVEVYNGEIDYSLNTSEVGLVAQTSNYILSMPLTQDVSGNYILPKRGDKVSLNAYGETIELKVNDYIPSQVGGITIYATNGNI